MNRIKTELEKFVTKNWLLLLCATITTFVLFGNYIWSDGIKIDTVYFTIDADSNYNWLSIGRFGLVLIKYLLNLGTFNTYYAGALFFIFTIIAEVCWIYFIQKHTKLKHNFAILCSLFLVFGGVIFAEQLFFILQYAEIMVGLIMLIISAELTYSYVRKPQKTTFIIAVLLNIISFGIYQSFLMVYLALLAATYILEYSNTKEKFWPVFWKYCEVFMTSFCIFMIIYKFFSASNYLSIAWAKEPVLSTLMRVILQNARFIIAPSFYNDYSFIIVGVGLIIVQVLYCANQKSSKVCKDIASVIVFLVIPFGLNIVTGQVQEIRTQLALPITIALGFLIILDRVYEVHNKTLVRLLPIIVTATMVIFASIQFKTSCELRYADDLVTKTDIELANNIYKDISSKIGDISKYELMIIGNRNIAIPESAQTGSMLGTSIFNFLSTRTPYYLESTAYVECIWKAEGKDGFAPTSIESAQKALQYVKEHPNMDTYPNQQSILVKDGLVIVRLPGSLY